MGKWTSGYSNVRYLLLKVQRMAVTKDRIRRFAKESHSAAVTHAQSKLSPGGPTMSEGGSYCWLMTTLNTIGYASSHSDKVTTVILLGPRLRSMEIYIWVRRFSA